MRHDITYVGLDAHKNSIVAAALLPGEPQSRQWELLNEKRYDPPPGPTEGADDVRVKGDNNLSNCRA